MNRNTPRYALLLLLVCVIPVDHSNAQTTSNPWYGRQAKPKDFDNTRLFAGSFFIELPKDWQVAPGYTGTIFFAAEKTKPASRPGGVITVEHMRLQLPLDSSIIQAAAALRLKEVQAREPDGKQFGATVTPGLNGPIILIQYDRPGLQGADDHIVQYLIPVDTVLYSVICVAPAASIDRYRPIFAHVAASFTPRPPSS